VVGSYLNRIRVGAFAQRHLLRFVMRAAGRLIRADPRALADYGGKNGRKTRLRRLRFAFLRDLTPRLLRTYSPRYDPRNIRLPSGLPELADRYTAMAERYA
jgi:hypothetical protein